MVLCADRAAEPFRLRDASVGGKGLQPAFRDADARDAFRQALRRFDEPELEQRQIAGYRKTPTEPTEFDVPESDHA